MKKNILNLKNNKDTQKVVLANANKDTGKIYRSFLNDDTLYNMIGRIPEVKALIKKVNSKYRSERVSIMINERPENDFKYYWLQVGIDNDAQFLPVYNFFIKDSSLAVSYFDTSKDSVISLKDWRNNRGW